MKYIAYGLKFIIISFFSISFAIANDFPNELQIIQQGWAKANYKTTKKQQPKAFETLVTDIDLLIKQYPQRAEPVVWKAIIISTQAGIIGGLSALKKVKQAHKLLLKAEKIEPETLNGSIYTSLGSLYYKVPSWPIAFGSNKKAEISLKKALAINPDGIDPNYFYADFLFENGQYAEAATYLQRAMNAPARTGRPLADAGRRQEIKQLMQKVKAKLVTSQLIKASKWS